MPPICHILCVCYTQNAFENALHARYGQLTNCVLSDRFFHTVVFFSQIDLVTDILYYYYTTFASVLLERLALVFIVLPLLLLMFFGLLCYGALPSGQFAYRVQLRNCHMLLFYVVEMPVMLLLLGWDTSMVICKPLWTRRRAWIDANIANIIGFVFFKARSLCMLYVCVIHGKCL